VTGGTLAVSGTGDINTTSGITVNGNGAAFMQNSSVPNSRNFILTRGTLGGTGILNNAVTAGANVILAPGDRTLVDPAKGTLTVNNSVTLAAGSSVDIRLFGPTANDSDKLVQGTAGTMAFNGTLNVSLSGSWTPVAGTTYDLFDWIGTATGTFSAINLPELEPGFVWHDFGGGVPFDYTTGQIRIVAGSANTYAAWLTLNAPATGFDTDTDLDGIPNGVENVLGTNPNLSSAGLTEVASAANSVTFKHQLNPTTASDVSYGYQWTTDMVEWKTSGQSNTGGTSTLIVASAPDGNGVVTVTMTITGGPAARLFGRLVAVQ
jgi:hypothetical protein